MQVYIDAIQRLNLIEQDIAAAVAELQATRASLEQEQAALVAQRNERAQLVANVDTELHNKGNALEQLQQDRTALQKVIEQIERQRELARLEEQKRLEEEQRQREQEQQRLAEQQLQAQQAQQKEQQEKAKTQQAAQAQQPAEPATTPTAAPESVQPTTVVQKSGTPRYSTADLQRLQKTSFAQRKGQLPWPTRGKLVSRFGEQRQGSVTWDGLRIQATTGSDVRAVHGGRVMYADWLRGQGMLVVLDHGDGFMSLYAHNDVLLHEPGEWVQPGDTIARVGNSGGEKEPALYFEIRQNGQPVNPLPWLGKP